MKTTLVTQAEADKTKDVFVGMWRPPFPEVHERFRSPDGRYILRRNSSQYYTEETLREEWLGCRFDEPLFKRMVEEDHASASENEPTIDGLEKSAEKLTIKSLDEILREVIATILLNLDRGSLKSDDDDFLRKFLSARNEIRHQLVNK